MPKPTEDPTGTRMLRDADTNDAIGPAAEEQIEASDEEADPKGSS